jgi:tetratricopeptide (TPR) repeat protein
MRVRFDLEMVDPRVTMPELEASTKADGDDVYSLRAIALNHLTEGRLDEAGRLFERCVTYRPNDIVMWESWLIYLDNRADLKRLETAIAKLPEGAERSPECLKFRANYKEQRGDRSGAIADLKRAIELGSFDPAIYYQLGQLLTRIGKSKEGAELIARSQELRRLREQLQDAFEKYRNEWNRKKELRVEIATEFATIFEKIGHLEEALAWHRCALVEHASHTPSIQAVERLLTSGRGSGAGKP